MNLIFNITSFDDLSIVFETGNVLIFAKYWRSGLKRLRHVMSTSTMKKVQECSA